MIELRINSEIVDIEDPDKFNIALRRQLINPSELNLKDAQKSYSITLPASTRNNAIFGNTNIEEVRGKFANLYDATLHINEVRIFDGKFILSKIDRKNYEGNLLVLAVRSIKDIFGDRYLNDSGEWKIDFTDFKTSIEGYNTLSDAPCIFPLVLYGLLPKMAGASGNYTSKHLLDDTVRFGVDDFPPSINVLKAVKKIFENEGFSISGSAFNDERLNSLFMSYKNPVEYQMPWNFGYLSLVELSGTWSNYKNLNTNQTIEIERTTTINGSTKVQDPGQVYNVDLLSSINGIVDVTTDNGGNVVSVPIDDFDRSYTAHSIVVPYSGLYEITFSANIAINEDYAYQNQRWVWSGFDKELRLLSPVQASGLSTFERRRYEVKVIRDRGEGDFNFANIDIDRDFYRDNIDQNTNFDGDIPGSFPKFFPKGGEVCFIDPKQNPNVLCGISVGKNYDKYNPYTELNEPNSKKYINTIAIKGGLSWDRGNSDFVASAVISPGYMRASKDDLGVLTYEPSNRFMVDVSNTFRFASTNDTWTQGSGAVNQVVWLEKGERLTVVASSDLDRNEFTTRFGTPMHDIDFALRLQAFQTNEQWITDNIDSTGSSFTGQTMNFNDPTDFMTDKIDLIKFLPSNVKINDWIDNFRKAFNLDLIQKTANSFELNLKTTTRQYNSIPIDLDDRANVDIGRQNEPLNLPSSYDIGFTINKDERGYYLTSDTGSEIVNTGNEYGAVLKQNTAFSFNWFELIQLMYGYSVDIPVITEQEIWEGDERDYSEMQMKLFTDLSQRFWYKGDNITIPGFNGSTIKVSKVLNAISKNTLSYMDRQNTILRNYFTLLTNNDACYTTIECYINPDEYERIPYTLVRLNGDIYYVAEIDGYSPNNNRKAKLKLIRKIL